MRLFLGGWCCTKTAMLNKIFVFAVELIMADLIMLAAD
jgi:hypothetical protein